MTTNQTTQHTATVSLLASLECRMPTVYQRRAWQALLALFLTPALRSALSSVGLVSASAASRFVLTRRHLTGRSRFLNRYTWLSRAVVRAVRAAQFQLL